MNEPLVSVVMCTYNRADLLEKAIASLVDQRVDFDYDILIVDNSSTDHTQDVIQAAVASSPIPIRSVIEAKPGISAARNRSLREARGEWIASIDDDEVADPNWLQQLFATAEAHDARCVGGRVNLQLPSETINHLSPVCRDLLGESTLGEGEQPYTRRITPSTCNVLIHRSVFQEVGGFDEDEKEGGEDTDLFRRIRQAGIVAWHTPRAILRHHVPDYRLSQKYLLWSAERNGWHIAKREHFTQGRWRFPIVLVGRCGQLLLRFLPRYLVARLMGNPSEILGARCLLRRSKAYVQCGISLLVPNLFSKEHLNFRSEREMFTPTHAAP